MFWKHIELNYSTVVSANENFSIDFPTNSDSNDNLSFFIDSNKQLQYTSTGVVIFQETNDGKVTIRSNFPIIKVAENKFTIKED